MKKNLIVISCVLFLSNLVFADPAWPDSVLVHQPDGTDLWVFDRGDEYCHWVESTDGYVILKNADGVFEYATVSDAQIEPSGRKVNNLQSKSISEIYFAKRQRNIVQDVINTQHRKSRRNVLPNRTPHVPSSPVVGIFKVLTILVGFPDKPFTYSVDDFDALMNEVGYSENGNAGSVRDYYFENSYGQLTIQSSVIGPYTATQQSSNYVYSQGGNATNAANLVHEAINWADNQGVDFSMYDGNNDGYVDCVHIIYAGNRYSSGGYGIIWPFNSKFITPIEKDGKNISEFIMTPEKIGTNESDMTTIGVICHELGHVFGAPDFYPIGISSPTKDSLGTGMWDVMADGSSNLSGQIPSHHNPFTKTCIYGWTTPHIISAGEKNSIYNIPASTIDSNAIYKFSTNTDSEYYLLENRQKQSFDSGLLYDGLLIYHISADIMDSLQFNSINNTLPQSCYLVNPASKLLLPNDTISSYGPTYRNIFTYNDPSYWQDNIFFTSQTTPGSVSWDSVPTGVDICFIQHDGNNMKFVVNPQIEGPTYVCDSTYYYVRNLPEGATVHWTGSMVTGNSIILIIGSSDNDSVLFGYPVLTPMIPSDTIMTINPNTPNWHFDPPEPGEPAIRDTTMTITATVSYAGRSYTMQKLVYASDLGTPRVQVSDTATRWKRNTPRTFTITNCAETPDSLLIWAVFRTFITPQLEHLSLGRSMTYTPTITGSYTVIATNVNMQCGTESTSMDYVVYDRWNMRALVTDGFLQLDIWDENEVEQKSHQWGSNIYSIDLWHPVYGLMNSYKLQSATEQIDTKGLPFGVYIIVLKENGTIIANTKVLIR